MPTTIQVTKKDKHWFSILHTFHFIYLTGNYLILRVLISLISNSFIRKSRKLLGPLKSTSSEPPLIKGDVSYYWVINHSILPSGSYSKSIPRFVSTVGVRPGIAGCSGLVPNDHKKMSQFSNPLPLISKTKLSTSRPHTFLIKLLGSY